MEVEVSAILFGIITLTVMISIGIARLSSDSFKEQLKTSLKVFFISWVIGIGLSFIAFYIIYS